MRRTNWFIYQMKIVIGCFVVSRHRQRWHLRRPYDLRHFDRCETYCNRPHRNRRCMHRARVEIFHLQQARQWNCPKNVGNKHGKVFEAPNGSNSLRAYAKIIPIIPTISWMANNEPRTPLLFSLFRRHLHRDDAASLCNVYSFMTTDIRSKVEFNKCVVSQWSGGSEKNIHRAENNWTRFGVNGFRLVFLLLSLVQSGNI